MMRMMINEIDRHENKDADVYDDDDDGGDIRLDNDGDDGDGTYELIVTSMRRC